MGPGTVNNEVSSSRSNVKMHLPTTCRGQSLPTTIPSVPLHVAGEKINQPTS